MKGDPSHWENQVRHAEGFELVGDEDSHAITTSEPSPSDWWLAGIAVAILIASLVGAALGYF